MVLDYSHFDNIGDDDEELVQQIKKTKEYSKPENSLDTHVARGILNDELMHNVMSELHVKTDRDEKLKIDEKDSVNLLTFITLQANYGKDGKELTDNTPREKPIIDFLQRGTVPKSSVLLAMMWAIQKRIDKSGRPQTETDPLKNLLLGALNTLLGIAKQGSAKSCFYELKKNPTGPFATRYFARELAKERFDKYAAKASAEETAWRYGDAPPWRNYTPMPVQEKLDSFAINYRDPFYDLCEAGYGKWMLVGACLILIAVVKVNDYMNGRGEAAPGSEIHGIPADVKAAAASFVGVHDEV